ncbi:MAG: ASKHA domain-containing protein, partial [Candidatus Adiutrix sp.]|nr:ASKHA domain-containing protein [Candidatus Adiutrix sp.]
MPHQIAIPATGRIIEAAEGLNLREALAEAGLFLESPCGGAGQCGKCRVEILDGRPPEPTAEEKALLPAEDLARPVRLACLLVPGGNLTIRLPQTEKEALILSSGRSRAAVFEPPLAKTLLAWPGRRPSDDGRPLERLFADLTGAEIPAENPDLRPLLAEAGEEEITILWAEGRPRDLEKGDTTAHLYGLAVDLGTTTIVASLVDLRDGRELGARSLVNPQTRQGLDVLSRITYCGEKGAAGTAELRQAAVGALNDLALGLSEDHRIDPRHIRLVSVAANTTMLHLLAGISPASLGAVPFAPVFIRGLDLYPAGFGSGPLTGAGLMTLPSVSAYIGADIVAGVFVCDLASLDRTLFIDIGTNGEIILAADGRLLACSCAAGPALEGMNIQYGMRAAAGAIEEVSLKWTPAECRTELSVIGGGEPTGLCGSGLMAAIREFLRLGLIRRDGRMITELPEGDPRRALCRLWDNKPALGFTGSDLCLTQKDVRQVQLAKGAILSAFRTLLLKTGLEMTDLERVLVAGQFGSYLLPASLIGCGILPPEMAGRLEYVGNTSKVGAYLALTSRSARKAME